MDALRVRVTRAEISLRAATCRQVQAATQLTKASDALKVALCKVKENSEAKEQADEAVKEVKAAQEAYDVVTEEKSVREAEAADAKQNYNEHRSSRPRRINAKDKFEGTHAPKQSLATAEGYQTICQMTVLAFHAQCKAEFADYSSMEVFPEPPAAPCGKTQCIRNKKDRALEACPCNIRNVFSNSTLKELKSTRYSFHPDRFNAEFKAEAKEVYTVVDQMFQKLSASPRANGKKIFQQTGRKSEHR